MKQASERLAGRFGGWKRQAAEKTAAELEQIEPGGRRTLIPSKPCSNCHEDYSISLYSMRYVEAVRLRELQRVRFEPKSDEDIAKSFLLSTQFHAGDEDDFGKSSDELLEISHQIRRGEYKFDPDDVQRHLTAYQEFKRSTPMMLIVDLVK